MRKQLIDSALAACAVLATVGTVFYSAGPKILGLGLLLAAAGIAIVLVGFVVHRNVAIVMLALIVTVALITSISYAKGGKHGNKDATAKGPDWCRSDTDEEATQVAGSESSARSGVFRISKLLVTEQVAGVGPCINLDVTAINHSGHVRLIQEARMKLAHLWTFARTCVEGGKGGGGLEPSKNYSATLTLTKTPSTLDLNEVTQYLKSEDVDRFAITVRLDLSKLSGEGIYVAQAQLLLATDEPGQSLESAPFLFTTTGAISRDEFRIPRTQATPPVIGPSVHHDHFAENLESARQVAALRFAKSARVGMLQDWITSPHIAACPF